MDHMHKQFAFC